MPRQLKVISGPAASYDRDAVRIGELYRDARTSMADSVRYLIDAGHRLIAKKDSVGHGRWLPWLEAIAEVLGFETRQTAHKLMQAALKCRVDATFDNDEALQISRQIWGQGNVRGTQGTGDNEWHTPQRYLALAREVLGVIDLDPASSFIAQKTVQATKCFTGGLTKEWQGRVWLTECADVFQLPGGYAEAS
jgi:hypothetical protein